MRIKYCVYFHGGIYRTVAHDCASRVFTAYLNVWQEVPINASTGTATHEFC